MPYRDRSIRRRDIHHRQQENERLGCGSRRCHRRRHVLSRFCAYHAKRIERYGHCDGGPVRARYLRPHRRFMRAYIKRNAENPRVREAIAFLDRLLAGRRVFRARPTTRCAVRREASGSR